jgi:hypothetical protein
MSRLSRPVAQLGASWRDLARKTTGNCGDVLRTNAADRGVCEEIYMFQEENSAKEFRTRFDPLLHEKIKCAAKDSFRSMTAEVSYRLHKSFEQNEAAQTTSAT